jgi:hypothetical protein
MARPHVTRDATSKGTIVKPPLLSIVQNSPEKGLVNVAIALDTLPIAPDDVNEGENQENATPTEDSRNCSDRLSPSDYGVFFGKTGLDPRKLQAKFPRIIHEDRRGHSTLRGSRDAERDL